MTIINEYTYNELCSFYNAIEAGSRYVMLRGGTGTGKTMYAKELAWWLTHDVDESKLSEVPGKVNYNKKYKNDSPYVSPVNQKYYRLASEEKSDDQHILLIPFHKGRTYENTVYGLSLKTVEGKITYNNTKQKFIEICETADGKPAEKFVIIFDDVNRSDLSRALGDVMQALELSGKNRSIPIEGETVEIPDNLYIIATANPTFGSSPDYAWLRRFLVFDIMPDEQHITAPEYIRFRNRFDNGYYFIESDYEKFLDYSYCIFTYVKIMYERYFTDDDSVIKLQNCPGHGMFMLPYVEGQLFEEYVEQFHLKLKHIIVPFLRCALAEGLLKNDEVMRFDIKMLEQLGDYRIDRDKEFNFKISCKVLKGKEKNFGKLFFMRYLHEINKAISDDSILYFLFLRNPIVLREAKFAKNLCFLFETNNWQYDKTSYSITDPEYGLHLSTSSDDYNIGIELYNPTHFVDSNNANELASTTVVSSKNKKAQAVPVYSLLIMYLKIIMRICPKSLNTIKGISERFGRKNNDSCKKLFTDCFVS